MLLNHEVNNDVGRKARLIYTRLRYELEISTGIDDLGLDQLYISHEALKAIPSQSDTWAKKYQVHAAWLPEPTVHEEAVFIETGTYILDITGVAYLPQEEPIITVWPEDQQRKNPLQYRARDLKSTTLNLVRGAEYLPISAAREEILLWKIVHLDTEELRKFSSTRSPRTLSPRGSNLASTLVRMQAEDKFALGDVSRDMANLVPGILKVRVEHDKAGDRYIVYAETSDKRVFSSQVLSMGHYGCWH